MKEQGKHASLSQIEKFSMSSCKLKLNSVMVLTLIWLTLFQNNYRKRVQTPTPCDVWYGFLAWGHTGICVRRGGGRVVQWCWVNFQCLGVLLIWIGVGQGPFALAVGAGGGCLDIFSLVCNFSCLSPSLWETARYRLKYCLKRPLSPTTTTKQQQALGENSIFIVSVQFYREMAKNICSSSFALTCLFFFVFTFNQNIQWSPE